MTHVDATVIDEEILLNLRETKWKGFRGEFKN